MHIVQIGPYPLSPDCIHGGVEASVRGLAQAQAQEHTVNVFDMPRIGEKDRVEHNERLTIHRYANPGAHNQDAARRVADICRDILALGPDVCHVHGTGAFSRHIYTKLRQHGLKVMLTVHGLLYEEKKQALLRHPSLKYLYQFIIQTRDERALLNIAPEVIVDTEYVEQKLRGYHLHHTPIIHVIPQGIDDVYFDTKCNSESNLILSVGAIGPRKGHLYTIEMFNRLRKAGVDAQLHIIGTMADRAYYDLLQKKIAESLYAESITLDVDLPREELLMAYASAKLFVLHSREESQGIVFAEAMATSLPIVATNVGGIPYVVADYRCGLLCNYGDVYAMVENTKQLLTNNALWAEYSANALIDARSYDWSRIVKNIESLYIVKG